MGKGKRNDGVANRSLYSRVSFLYQAAALLATPSQQGGQQGDGSQGGRQQQEEDKALLQGISRKLLTDLRAVALKTQMRLTPKVKRTICKFCDAILIEGETCTSTVENKSKGGKKPWADVLVVKCDACGRERRYPVDAPRQPRRPHRTKAAGEGPTA